MHAARAVGGRLARLLVLACTVLGVVALHTIGHAGVTTLDHHRGPVTVAAPLTAAVTAAAIPDEAGCDGASCSHDRVAAGWAADSSRWWDACVGILDALAVAVALGLGLRVRRFDLAAGAGPPWPVSPDATRRSPVGLTLAAVAVLRT